MAMTPFRLHSTENGLDCRCPQCWHTWVRLSKYLFPRTAPDAVHIPGRYYIRPFSEPALMHGDPPVVGMVLVVAHNTDWIELPESAPWSIREWVAEREPEAQEKRNRLRMEYLSLRVTTLIRVADIVSKLEAEMEPVRERLASLEDKFRQQGGKDLDIPQEMPLVFKL